MIKDGVTAWACVTCMALTLKDCKCAKLCEGCHIDDRYPHTCDRSKAAVSSFKVAYGSAEKVPEYSGGSVDYYKVRVVHPTKQFSMPYDAECNDIIEALGMNFAEGNAFKALWCRAAMRTLGLAKAGAKADGLYDAQKVVFFGERLVEQSKAVAK